MYSPEHVSDISSNDIGSVSSDSNDIDQSLSADDDGYDDDMINGYNNGYYNNYTSIVSDDIDDEDDKLRCSKPKKTHK